MSDLAKGEKTAALRVADMESALDLDFEGWQPEPGEKLTGHVLYVTTAGADSEYGEYPLVAVVNADGQPVAVHAFHSVLKNEIERWNPQSGDVIGIKYKGRKEEGGFGDKGYEDYNVIVQHLSQP